MNKNKNIYQIFFLINYLDFRLNEFFKNNRNAKTFKEIINEDFEKNLKPLILKNLKPLEKNLFLINDFFKKYKDLNF